jgi:hypothetical protein
MLIPRTRDEALTAVETEIRAEKAASLGRVSKQLEAFLADAAAVRLQLETTAGEARAPLLKQHAQARAGAEKYLWYLIVQREALGLFRHDEVEERYPVPPALKE